MASIGATYSCASDELLHSECLLRSDVTGSTSIFMNHVCILPMSILAEGLDGEQAVWAGNKYKELL